MWGPLYEYVRTQQIHMIYGSVWPDNDIEMEKAERKIKHYNKKYGIENIQDMFHKVSQDIYDYVDNDQKCTLKNLYLRSIPAYVSPCASLPNYQIWSYKFILDILNAADKLYISDFVKIPNDILPDDCLRNSPDRT